MRYTWFYGVFHWFVHYLLAIGLVWSANFHLVDITIPYTLFVYVLNANVVDYFIIFLATSLIDLDHLTVYKKFGRRGIFVFAAKRIPYPLHNFFFLGLFASISAFTAIFGLKILSILIFAPVLHMVWDIFEDAFIFRTSYRKWEKTWGLKTKDLEKMWKDMQQKGSAEI